MKKFYVLMLLFAFGITSMVAQTLKPVAAQVVSTKTKGTTFTDVSSILQLQKNVKQLKGLKNAEEASLFTYDKDFYKKSFVNQETKTVSMTLPLEKNYSVVVDLVEVSASFYDYGFSSDSGKQRPQNNHAKHYRGTVRGKESSSLVAISFFNTRMMGIVSIEGKGSYNIGKLRDREAHIIFRSDNIEEEEIFECGAMDPGNQDPLPYTQSDLTTSSASDAIANCVRVFFEVDYDIYDHFGGNTADVENFVTGLFNQTAAIYQNESITVQISEIFIWDTTDPYTGSASNRLNTFRTTRTSFNGDIAHLLTFRSSSASGIAYVDVLCDDSHAYGNSHLFPSFATFPTYSRQVKVVTHEIGHNLGSRHTHDCVWNGNNTQIDDYGSVLPNGTPNGPSSCFTAPGILNVTPTIMSYFDSYGHGTFPMSNGFGTQPGNLIRNRVANANCLDECVDCTTLVDFHFEHEDGTEDTIFNICEDVYMDGSATANTGSYYIDIWRVNPSGSPTWLSRQGVNGWAQGSPNLINITQLFENDQESPVNFQAGVTYEVKLAISHPECGWVEVVKQFTYVDEVLVDFHFEHENGVEDTVFNLCEDVFLDGSATVNTGSYFMDIWRVNGNGTLSWLSAQDPNGWAQGSPDLINVTQTFVNDSNNPVTFQAGVTYEVKLAISHPDCGWVSETRRFTYEEGQMSSLFDIVDYDCHDGVFDVTVTAQDAAPSQWWRVYETDTQGATSDANTIGFASGIQSGTTTTFTNLDPTKFYYIKHGVYTSNCPWQETRIPLAPDCCDEFTSGDFSVGVDFDYDFWVGNYEGYEDLGATHEWYVLSSPNETGGPYTPEFSTTTTGGSNFQLFSGGQYGVYYTIVHKVVTYCGEICFAQVQYQKEGEAVRAESSAVAAEIDCCLVFDFWPNGPGAPEVFTAEFNIGIDPQTGTIQTFVPNTYPNNSNIEHEWTLYSSPNETGGPFTLVDESNGVNYSYTAAENGLYYFLFHRATSDCGDVCYAQTICRNCGKERDAATDCKFCGEIDCSLIDEIQQSICDAPTSLSYNCQTAILNWEDIPNADSYIVEIIWDDPSCCKSDKGSNPKQWSVTNSQFQLPFINISGCFSWKVGVKCKDNIVWSDKKCSTCITKPHEPHEPHDPKDTVATAARISPNPNNGNMNIEISGADNTNFTVKVYRFDGSLLKTFNNNRIESGSASIKWNGTSVLSPGMYFFVITTDTETITKKVVVK